MVSRRLSILGLISAAAIVSGVLAGCGGSSASVTGTSAELTTQGGLTSVGGSTNAAVPTATTPQQVQVTTDTGLVVSATVPANMPAIATGDPVGVLTPDSAVLDGLDYDDGQPTFKAQTPNLTKGHLYWSTTISGPWSDTGVKLNTLKPGHIDGFLIAPLGYYYFLLQGPIQVRASGRKLTFQHMYLGVQVSKRLIGNVGIFSAPQLSVRLPGNGGSTANSNYVNVTYPYNEFQTGSGYLKLTGFLLNNTKIQNHPVVGGKVSFSDPGSDGAVDIIPATGLQDIIYLMNRTN